MHNPRWIPGTITLSMFLTLEARNKPKLTHLKLRVHNYTYKQQGDPWNLQMSNTAALRHSLIYTGMSFSRWGWRHKTLICDVDGALVQAWAGISVHHQVWDLCARVVPKPTQPPDSRAGPRGSLRSWTTPPGCIPLSCPLSCPPRQALEVVCCRRWAETCKAVGCPEKGSNTLLKIHKSGIKEAQSHLFPLPQLSLPTKSTESNPD